MASVPKTRRVQLNETAIVDVTEHWLPPDESAQLLSDLRQQLEWSEQTITLFGRRVLQPRLIAWAGTVDYRYSGLTLPARAAPACLESVTTRLCSTVGVPFNHVLINRYRNGHDHMGWHADDEPELGPDPTVACLTLGATRDLLFKPKDHSVNPPTRLSLANADVVVMSGTVQRHFLHSVPKRKRVAGERISLTTRWIRRPSRP
jgi:alkylated DNA repair dioxygenase AlkB